MKQILFLLPFMLSTIGFSQTKEMIVGKWKFEKHEVTIKGKSTNPVSPGGYWIYEFKKDGTYTCQRINQDSLYTFEKGKWKLQNNNKELFFYGADLVPHQNNVFLGDHPSKIISVTKTTLILTENHTEAAEGKSYYKRIKD